MSARQELLDALYAGDVWDAPGVPERLIDAYAHELAEQQRAWAREVGVPLEDGDVVSAGDVIDLIDPFERPAGGEETP